MLAGVRLDALGDLRELRLYANQIAHVRGLNAAAKLQTLLLHDNQLGPECNAGGDGLLPLCALTTLRVDTNPRLGTAGLAELHSDLGPDLGDLERSRALNEAVRQRPHDSGACRPLGVAVTV